MWLDTRHKVFVYVLAFLVAFVLIELVLPEMVFWKRWLFVWIPFGIVFDRFVAYMGWYRPKPADEWEALSPEQRAAARFGAPRA